MDDKTMLLLAIPIALIQLALMIVNLVNITKKSTTKHLNKTIWLLLILITGYLGNLAYLFLEGEHDDSN